MSKNYKANTRNLYNRYSNEAEERDDDEYSADARWEKFKERNSEEISKASMGASNNNIAALSHAGMSDMQKAMSIGAERSNKLYEAAKNDRAALMPELEAKKVGKESSTKMAASSDRISTLSQDTLAKLKEFQTAYENGDAERQEQIQNEVMSANGWNNSDFINNMNDYRRTVVNPSKGKNVEVNKDTYLTPTEEVSYVLGKRDQMNFDQKNIFDKMVTAYKSDYADKSGRASDLSMTSDVIKNVRGALSGEDPYQYKKDIDQYKNTLRSKYGMTDSEINDFENWAKTYAYAEKNQEVKDVVNQLPTGAKVAANIGSTLLYSPVSGATAMLSNTEDRASGFGRSTTSPYAFTQHLQDYSTQAVQNDIGEDHPVGQFLYGAGLSTLSSTENMMLWGGAIQGAGAVSDIAKELAVDASLTSFMTSSYNSSYEEARQRGATDSEAQLYGAICGSLEGITEKISADKLWDIAGGDKKMVGQAIKNMILVQPTFEASEEMINTIASDVADRIIMGDKSNYQRNYETYIQEGKTPEEAQRLANKQLAWEIVEAGASGYLSGMATGAGATAMNYLSNYGRTAGISDYYGNYNNEGTTDFDQQQRDQAGKYANNPARYIADSIDDSTKEGRAAKNVAMKIAEKEASGKKLSYIDRVNLYNAEMVGSETNSSADALSSQRAYAQYAAEAMAVPKEFRTAQTGITAEEGRAKMQEAADKGDLKALSDTYNLMKNSTSAEARADAEAALDSVKGRSDKIASLQIDGIKTSTQDAYLEGRKGTERSELGILSSTAQEAYDKGRIQYLETKATVDSSESVKHASVTTESGGHVLTGKIVNGKAVTEAGDLINIADTDGDTTVKKVYGFASNYKDNIANAIVENLQDGDNVNRYLGAAASVIASGRTGGVTLEQAQKSSAGYELGEDRTKALFSEAALEYRDEVRSDFKVWNDKSTGKRVGFTNHSSSNTNTQMFEMLASVSGLNVELWDQNAVVDGKEVFTKGENAAFIPGTGTIRLGTDNMAQVFHELGEFVQAYNSEGYENVRKALVNAAIDAIGVDNFQSTQVMYKKAYANAGQKMSDWQISSEMANDLIVDMMATDKGRKAFSEYLVKNYSAKEANNIKGKIKNLFGKIISAIRSLFKNSHLTQFQKKVLENNIEGLENNVDAFIEAFNQAAAKFKEINEITDEMLDAIGDNAEIITNEEGMPELAVSEDQSTILVNHSLATVEETNEKLYNIMIKNGYTKAEAQAAVDSINRQVEWLKEIATGYQEMSDSLETAPAMKLTTDVENATQVFNSFVTNGDYAVNIDFLTICKKRQAYMRVLNDLIDEGIFNQVVFDGSAIADVNDILRGNNFETACLCCFVESRRLQIQKWANTFASEWNAAVRAVNKNATPFPFSGKKAEDVSKMQFEDLAKLENELSDQAKNSQGNLNLGTGGSKAKMPILLQKAPSLAHTIEAGDLLKPANIREIKRLSPDLYSLIKGRYGTASPKIVQEFNPYNGEVADLSQGYMQSINGSNIAGMGAYNSWASDLLAKAVSGEEYESLPEEIQRAVDRFVEGSSREVMARNIKRYIKRKKLTASDVAAAIGVDADTVNGWINAETSPSKANIEAMAELFNCDVSKITDGKNNSNKIWKATTKNQYANEIALMKYLYDVGGVRLQSFSDFLIENVLDYFQLFGDLQAKSLPLHAYSKEIAFARIFGMTGAKLNMSLIPVVDRALGKEYAGLTKDGKYAGWGDFKHHIIMGGQSYIQSIGFQDAVALQLDPRYSSNVGTIAIGISDEHIKKMLNDKFIRMVIPYHASGMTAEFAKKMDIDLYNDYTEYQNTRVNAEGGKATSKYNIGSCTFEYNGKTITIDGEFNFNEACQRYNGDAKMAAGEYLAWCAAEHSVSSEKDGSWDSVTFLPKFGASPYGYDFSKEENYYKLLEDFNVYDYEGNVARQGAVTMTYPDGLNAEQEAVYRQRLEESGMFNAEEIEKYVAIAKKNVQELVRDEATARNKYHRQQDAVYDKTFGEITDKLLKDHNPEKRISEEKDAKKRAEMIEVRNMIERKSISVDSEGNTLTEAQQEYFKDSKVRDEEGRLKVYYHGSRDAGFVVFNPEYTFDGISMFFTDDPIVAKSYSGTYDIFKPDGEISEEKLSEWIEEFTGGGRYLTHEGNKYNIYELGYIGEGDNLVYSGDLEGARKDFVDYISENTNEISINYEVYLNVTNPLVVEANGLNWDELPVIDGVETNDNGFATTMTYSKYAKEKGYDGVIFKDIMDVGVFSSGDEANNYSEVVIAFDSNQVKSVNNENPTTNPDIRYSITFDDFISDDELNEAIMEELEDEIMPNNRWNTSIDDIMAALEESIESNTKRERKKAQRHLTRAALGTEFQEKNGKSLAFTDERIDKYLRAYAATQKDYAQAYVTYMSPADFLLLTANGNRGDETFQRIKSESHELNWDEFKDESQPIFLDMDEKGVGGATKSVIIGHEGRHRMFALQMAGYTKVPVLVFNYDNKYSKSHIDSITVDPQRYNYDTKYNKSNKITLNDLEVLSTGNKDAIVSKFGSGAEADVRYSMSIDDEYMAAVKAYDHKKVRRLVDEAAKAAGYNVKAYHGSSKKDITIFRTDEINSNMGSHFGSKEIAKGFSKGEWSHGEGAGDGRIYSVYLKAQHPFETYDWFAQDDFYPMAEAVDLANTIGTPEALAIKEELLNLDPEFRERYESDDYDEGYLNDEKAEILYRRFRDLLDLGGYDSIKYENGLEVIGDEDYIIQHPEQIKLADDVVYDDNHNIIPLSERFNISNPDIRYSIQVDDSTGKQLTPGQQKFFENSKAVDLFGHLKVYYHGSRTPGFTVFDPMKSDDGISLFFTDGLDNAASYSGTLETFEPDKKYTLEELDNIIQSTTGGDWEVKQDGNDYIILEAGDYEETRGTLDDIRDYFVENYLKYSFEEYGSNYAVYLNATNPLVVETYGAQWNDLSSVFGETKTLYEYAYLYSQLDDDLWEIEYSEWGDLKTESFTRAQLEKKFGNDEALMLINGQEIDDIRLDADGNRVPSSTREVAAYAYDNGYDSVIFNDIIDYDNKMDVEETPQQVVIVFNSNQVKSVNNENPSLEDPDYRYSITYDDFIFSDEFTSESDQTFKASASILEEGMEALKKQKVDKKAITKIASKLISEYGSTAKIAHVADELTKAFAYMQTEDHVSYDSMMRVLSEIATPIVDQAVTKTGEAEYNAFMDMFRGRVFKLSAKQKSEVAYTFGSYQQFRLAMAPIQISDKGTTNLDSIWQEIADTGLVDRSVTAEDMPMVLFDLMQSLKPVVENDYGADLEDVSKDLAMRIVEEYLGTQDVARAKAAAAEAKAQLKTYRAQLKAAYNKNLQKVKAEGRYNVANANMNARWREAELKAKQDQKLDRKLKEADMNARWREAFLKQEYEKKLGRKLKEADMNAAWREAYLKKDQEEKLNNTVEKIKAKNKQRMVQAKERQKAAEQRKKIEKRSKELITWITNPSEKNHVPEDMKAPIIGFLQCLDFIQPTITENKGQFTIQVYDHLEYTADGKKKPVYYPITDSSREAVLERYRMAIGSGLGSQNAQRWADRMVMIQDVFDRIDSAQDYYKDYDMIDFVSKLDADLANDLRDMLSDVRENKLALRDLSSDHLKVINNVLANIQKAVRQGNRAFSMAHDMSELGNDTIAASKEVAKDPAMSKLKKSLKLDMATPKVFFKFAGKSGSLMYDALREGFNVKVRDIKNASEYMKDVLKDVSKKEMKEWTGKDAKIYEFNLDGGTLRFTAAEIMSLYETMKRDGGIDRMAGGIESAERMEGRTRVRQSDKVLVSIYDLQRIVGVLSVKQIEIADKMQQYLAVECSRQGNEVAMAMFGYEKFIEEHYFPYKVDQKTTQTNDKNLNNAKVTGIEHSGFTKALKKGAQNPLVMRDIFDVFTDHVTEMANYHGIAAPNRDVLRWHNYKVDNETVKGAVDRLVGVEGGYQYINKLLIDINNGEKSQYIGDITEAIMGRYKAAAVSANIRVVLQQPTAIFRALSMVDAKYLMKAFAHSIKSYNLGKIANEDSMIMWWKSQGYYETGIGKSMKEVITGLQSPIDQLKDKLMAPAGKADDITWSFLYNAVRYEVKDQNPTLSGDELKEAVRKRFDDVVDMTQVVDSTMHRSQYMRSKDTLNKIQTSFMAEPIKTYNMLLESAHDLANNKPGAKAKAARVVAAIMIADIVNAAAQSLADTIRKKDDDEDWLEAFLDNMKSNFLDNINPFGLIPIVKDVVPTLWKAITGENTYGQSTSRLDMAAFDSIADAITETRKIITGESNKTAHGRISIYAKPISYLTGVPVYNIYRDATALYGTFFGNLKKTVEKPNDKYSAVYSEMSNGKDQSEVDDLVKAAIEKGGTIGDIRSGIQSRYKSDYYDAYQDDPETADKIAEEAAIGYRATGMSEEDINDTISEWKNEVVSYKDLDAAIKSGEGIQQAIDMLRESKDDDKIIEHLDNKFRSTVEYSDMTGAESNIDDNLDKAYGYIDGRSYDDVVRDLDEAAEAKAEKAAARDAKSSAHASVIEAIDTGSSFKKAVDDAYIAGSTPTEVKKAITSQYKDELVKAKKSGKSVTAMISRIATVKAYCDQKGKPEIAAKYNGDYYQYEYDQCMKWFD